MMGTIQKIGEGIVVGVDIDGVIANLHTEWYRRYNAEFDDNLTVERVKSWDTHLYTKPECGKCIYKYLYDSDLYNNVAPLNYAIEGIAALREDGFRPVYVSSVVRGQTDAKFDWLVRYGFLPHTPGVVLVGGHPDFITAGDKSLIDVDLMIDDAPQNLVSFGKRAILFNYMHNHRTRRNEGLWTRVDDWREVPAIARFLTERHVVRRYV